MTVWYSFPTIFNSRRALRNAGLIGLCVALITTFIFSNVSHALPNVTRSLTFQGRLLTSGGAVVADGHYNMQFKIYQNGSGTTAGNPDGTLQWTETYVNNGGISGVEVKNGFFSVALGSSNPFGTSVDWNQDTLWLSMNIAGNTAACSTFGTAPCVADGEMLPMKRITATPFALNSGAVGGKTANDLVQLGQGVQTDTSNNSGIFINKTGTGNLVQLQAGGTDAFTLNSVGNITMGSAANQSISVATADSGAGKNLTVKAGSAASGSALAGGDLIVQGGAGDGSANGGNVIVKANGTDTTGTFQVQDAAGTSVFTVDTINSIVSAGTIKLTSGATIGSGVNKSLWNNGTVTGSPYNDGSPINVGTAFKSDTAGYVTGVKFYNPSGGNSGGAVTGKLWSCNNPSCSLGSGGTEMAAVTFSSDASGGWKTATFDSPILISPDTYYIVTTYSPTGTYYAASNYFATDYHNAPLHAMSSNTTPNGVFKLAGGASFPTGTYGSANYWVDVTFQPSSDMDRISSDKSLSITSGGDMTVGPTSYALNLQGSSIDISATNGGNVTIQGGNATISNGNGGSLLLSGGAGNGTGASGLVVLTTPTFSTATSDANCYTGGVAVSSDCIITMSSVDNSSAVLVGFNSPGHTAALPDPTIKTAGRIIYIMAGSDSEDFTLSINGGGAGNLITVHRNTTATILSNGSNWTVAGGSSSTTLQDAYTNTPQNAAGSDIVVSDDGTSTGGLTIRDSSTSPVNGPLLEIKNASNSALLSINSSSSTEYATDGGVHDSVNFSTNWSTDFTNSSVTRNTSDGQDGNDSAQMNTGTAAWDGIKNKLSRSPQPNAHYRIVAYSKLVAGSAFTDLVVGYSPDGGTTFITCTDYSTQTITTTGWTQITCTMDTPENAATNPYVYFLQPTGPASARTFLVDALSFAPVTDNAPNVKVGSGTGTGNITLFTLDKSASAPAADDSDSLLGSMYYDTTLGKVQCYESEGWGACGASPDIFVTISPEYTNAVMNGTDIGTITSDLCSDTLNINDGSSSQPTICGTNETYNFYKWTSAESTAQTRSIYVTYQLPSTFKNFAAGVTTLKGRTNSADSSVSYQVYRDDNSAGLAACGSAVSVSTGSQSTWQQAAASGSADPSTCGFEAGDSILFRINLTAKSDANAYVSNLSFVFNNN
jgi:hypothetical protein